MADYSFTLDGLDFGRGCPVEVESFDPGDTDIRTQDNDNPLGDGRSFGRDYRGAPTWTWQMFTNAYDEPTALASLSDLAKVWRGDAYRSTPGAVMELSYEVAGRRRRVYGRPRRFSYSTEYLLTGRVPISATFDLIDGTIFDDTESGATIDIVPAVSGGLTAPLVSPLATETGPPRDSYIDVGGTAPTFPVIRIDGPVSRPYVKIGSWQANVNLALSANEWVTIDTRPWQRTVLRNDYASVAGALGKSARMNDMTLQPGTVEVIFGGIDVSGTATCTVSWRPAYYTL